MAASSHTIAIPSALPHLKEVRHFVVQHAAAANWPKESVEAFKLAADEACTNVIKHAYSGKPGNTVEITVEVAPDRFKIRICDTGKSFDRSTYTVPNLKRFTKLRKRGGLGVHIIHQLMDQVIYSRKKGVNEILLVKRRPNRSLPDVK